MSDVFSSEVLAYIEEHKNTDPYSLLLKKSPFTDIDMESIVRQVRGRKVAQTKFPFLLDHMQYRYPIKLSLEQASSQKTAEYKSELISGDYFADLTGGMGIDSYLLGRKFKDCTYVEPNIELYTSTLQNFDAIGFHSVNCLNMTCEDFLSSNKKIYDWIYVDPSRRIEGNKKTNITNYEPNILLLKDQLLSQAKQVMVKLSPMQDITECVRTLKNVNEIFTISVKNDVKELLIILSQEECNNPKMTSVDLTDNVQKLTAQYDDKQVDITLSEVGRYIYQPAGVVIKSELQNYQAEQIGLHKINRNTQLFTSDKLEKKYFGRIFEVEGFITSIKKDVKHLISEKKANIITKNYPISPQQLGKKLKIGDGGSKYVLAFTDHSNKKVICVTKRLK